MNKSFLVMLLVLIPFLSACGQPLDGFEAGDLVTIQAGIALNPGNYINSCVLSADVTAQIVAVEMQIEGSTHHEQKLYLVPSSMDIFPCEGRDGLERGYVYGSSVSLYQP